MENENNPLLQDNATCPAIGYQAVNVNVPVTVTPFAQTGSTVTRCCGTPIIKSGKTIGQGAKNGVCNFTIGQNIVVAIPVAFGADATVGDTYVDAIAASADEIDCEKLSTLLEENQQGGTAPTTPSEP